jgi:hypothetical protein
MSASAFSLEVVIRLLLSTMRSYPSTPHQNASIVSVQAVSSSNLINSEHNFCIHKMTTHHLVSGDLPVDTIKKRGVCFIADASAWCVLLHRMDGETEINAGDERT